MGQGAGEAGGEAGGSSGDEAAANQPGKDAGARKPKTTQKITQKATPTTLRPLVVIEDGRKLLRVGGVIQSVHVDERYEPDIWDAMLPRERPEHVLILGLGGGTMAQLLTARFGPISITGVERDPAVIYLARHEFGLAHLPHIRIVAEDAFAFVRRAAESRTKRGMPTGGREDTMYAARYDAMYYDAICVDLYTAGKMAHGVFDPLFQRALACILAPGGTITFNLWRSPYLADQLRRIERSFSISELLDVGDNLVARCSHLPQDG